LQAALKVHVCRNRALEEARQIPGLQLMKLDINLGQEVLYCYNSFCGIMYNVAIIHTLALNGTETDEL
jgi:hypothetical protein